MADTILKTCHRFMEFPNEFTYAFFATKLSGLQRDIEYGAADPEAGAVPESVIRLSLRVAGSTPNLMSSIAPNRDAA